MHRRLLDDASPKLRKLMIFLEEKLRAEGLEQPAAQAQPMSEEKAATIIQRAWRAAPTKKQVMEAGHRGYNEWLEAQHANIEIQLLSELMFGRNVADIRGTYTFKNPNLDKTRFYHRSDYGKILEEGMLYLLAENFAGSDHIIDNYHFIPICLQNSLNAHEALMKIPNLKVLRLPNSPIAFLYKPEGFTNATFHDLSALGLIASPWEINQTIAQNRKKQEQPDFEGELISSEAFLKSDNMISLGRIALSKSKPTKHLAGNLLRIIRNLDIHEDDMEERKLLQRIHMMLGVAVNFYQNDYRSFSMVTSAIIHEVSLLAYHRLRKGEMLVNYEDFKNDTDKHITSKFGLSVNSRDLSTIAVPANSGTNAFAIALQIAKQLHPISPNIKLHEPFYYEFEDVVRSSKTKHNDIYVISAGPIISQTEGLCPGTDINKFIRNTILPAIEANIKNHITIVVDTTTALYKDIKLDRDLKKLVQQGKITLIGFESHQKFGLLHSDQAQYGCVFGIGNKANLSDTLVQDITQNAKKDLLSHLDMQVGAFINVAAGPYLEKVKEQHFRGGALLEQAIKRIHRISHAGKQRDDSLDGSDERLFALLPRQQPIAKTTHGIIPGRDSFGHFGTTTAGIGSEIVRLSPGASDTIDHLIDITAISAKQALPKIKLNQFYFQWMVSIVDRETPVLPIEDCLFLAGSLLAIRSQDGRKDKRNLNRDVVKLIGIQYYLNQPHPALQRRTVNKDLLGYRRVLERKIRKNFGFIVRFLKRPMDITQTKLFLIALNTFIRKKSNVIKEKAHAQMILMSFGKLGDHPGQITSAQLDASPKLIRTLTQAKKLSATDPIITEIGNKPPTPPI